MIEPADEQAPGIVTANELHVPATAAIEGYSASRGGPARPIYLTLQSADVCHSFWVPRLAGKTDLIPGARIRRGFKRQSRGYTSASAPNIAARSMPACYCEFTSIRRENLPPGWRTRPSRPSVTPPTSDGRQSFLAHSCVNCHTIRGTAAQGKFGPDLTHLAARKTIAGGMIEMNRLNLRRWIANPQQAKTGCLMPAFGLNDQTIDQITDYLMTLR